METLLKIKQSIDLLSILELSEIENYLALIIKLKTDKVNEIEIKKQIILEEEIKIKTIKHDITNCPFCNSTKIICSGYYKDYQRFKCNPCKRTFTSNNGNVFHYLKNKDKFIEYIKLFFEDSYLTIKEIALKIGISIETSFQWRHRILISLKSESPLFSGITELDDVWFLYSQKGRKGLKYSRKRGGSKRQGDNNFQAKIIIAKQRKSNLDMSLVRIGRITKEDLERKYSTKFTKDAILVSDKHASISSFAKSENIIHETFKAKEHVKDKLIHVQTVNNYACQLKSIINFKFKGVSTKYLQNYATWFSIKEKFKNIKDKTLNIIDLISKNKLGWDLYTNIEKLYENFILKYSVRTYRCGTKKKWKNQNWNFDRTKSSVFI
jgi:transposase-like protein